MKESPVPEPEAEIIKGLTLLNIPFSPSQISRLVSYIQEIGKWNQRINLVNAAGKTLLVRHVFDSLSGLFIFTDKVNQCISKYRGSEKNNKRYVSNTKNCNTQCTVLDIGSGAGFPGIPLSLFMPESTFILCERSGKRAGFLRNAVLVTRSTNLVVFEDDFRNLDKKVDIITFRAFSPLGKVINDLVNLLHPRGWIIAYKGRREKIEQELAGIDTSRFIIDVKQVDVPFLNEERHMVILQSQAGEKN